MMHGFAEKLRAAFRDDLFMHNRYAAYKRNKIVLRIVMAGAIVCFLLLLIASFLTTFFSNMRLLYLLAIAGCLLFIALSYVLPDKAVCPLAYLLQAAFVTYCAYSSAFIWPDSVCVMVVAGLFIFPTLFLDKSWHVTMAALLFSGLYLLIISLYKSPLYLLDELMNVVCSTILSCVVGTFARKAQLKNFDSIEQLRMSEEHYRLAIKHSVGMICEFNVAKRCIIMKPDVADVYAVEQTVYDVPYAPVRSGVISPDTIDAYIGFFEDIMHGSKTGTAEFAGKMADGWRWQRASYSTIFSEDGRPVSAVISFFDITEQRQREARQKKQAETDGLTGIYNRSAAEKLIERRLADSAALPCMLLIADLDQLKTINDTLGHPQGDRAIQAVASLLQNTFGQSGIVGRVGGDEFITFLSGIGTKADLKDTLDTLMEQLASIRVGEDGKASVNASIGIAFGTTGIHTFEELYRMADKALYHAKRNGKKQYAFFSHDPS